MDDQIRISDADRERVTARLREHFAEGRLSSDELDERITAALRAKTFGDLRPIMADLPDDEPQPPQPPAWIAGRRISPWQGPRIAPLLIVALIAALAIQGGGWFFFAFVKVLFAIWLVACLTGIVAAARFRRHLHRSWHSSYGRQWHHDRWRG
jgi:hypothetical protein